VNKEILKKHLRRLAPRPTALTPKGRLKEEIRCALFDIYGTLFISGSGDISLVSQNSPALKKIGQLLTEYGIRKSPRTLLNEFYCAIEAVHGDLREQGTDFPEVDIEQIWTQVIQSDDMERVRQFAAEFELIVNPVYPMPNLEPMLSAFRQRSRLMGLISNAQFYTPYLFSWFLNADPQDLGFDRDLLFYSYRFKVAKPSPRLFEMAAEKLKEKGIPPSAVLYTGNDMLNDIYPAKLVGFKAALFAGDSRSLRLRRDDSRCKKLEADLVITDLSQLIAHV
jgi:putative hydrolase of the HAD superfamily